MATVLQRDITHALRKLRAARASGNIKDAAVCERRLNWLLDRITDDFPSRKSDYENAKSDY